jgi:hypothetical protein
VVDVTHDGDHGRTRPQILDVVLFVLIRHIGGVVAFLDGLEAELAGNEFDLVEVEALVDGDHQPQRLEGKAHDLRGGDAENLREFGDRDELVHAHGLALTLSGRLALLLRLGAHFGAKATTRAATLWRAAQGGHGLGDVGGHRFLVHRAPLVLLAAALLLVATGLRGTRRAATLAATLSTLLATLTPALSGPAIIAALSLLQTATRSR